MKTVPLRRRSYLPDLESRDASDRARALESPVVTPGMTRAAIIRSDHESRLRRSRREVRTVARLLLFVFALVPRNSGPFVGYSPAIASCAVSNSRLVQHPPTNRDECGFR